MLTQIQAVEKSLDYTAKRIVFRFLLSQKEAGVYGGSAPVTLREAQPLRTQCGFTLQKR